MSLLKNIKDPKRHRRFWGPMGLFILVVIASPVLKYVFAGVMISVLYALPFALFLGLQFGYMEYLRFMFPEKYRKGGLLVIVSLIPLVPIFHYGRLYYYSHPWFELVEQAIFLINK